MFDNDKKYTQIIFTKKKNECKIFSEHLLGGNKR